MVVDFCSYCIWKLVQLLIKAYKTRLLLEGYFERFLYCQALRPISFRLALMDHRHPSQSSVIYINCEDYCVNWKYIQSNWQNVVLDGSSSKSSQLSFIPVFLMMSVPSAQNNFFSRLYRNSSLKLLLPLPLNSTLNCKYSCTWIVVVGHLTRWMSSRSYWDVFGVGEVWFFTEDLFAPPWKNITNFQRCEVLFAMHSFTGNLRDISKCKTHQFLFWSREKMSKILNWCKVTFS